MSALLANGIIGVFPALFSLLWSVFSGSGDLGLSYTQVRQLGRI